MNLGSKIVNIRKENKMSQEDFAEIFNVTRQTISSWENSKSYPDIETLVKISDMFNISLDILLKEDKKMIKEMDKDIKNTKKYKTILKVFFTIIGLLVCSFCIYSINYFIAKDKLEEKFATTLEENDFYKNREGYYSYDYNENIVFSVPNQTMPSLLEFSLDFHAKHLFCDINIDNHEFKITWIDSNDYSIYDYKDISKNETNNDYSFTLYAEQDINTLVETLNVDKELLENVIDKGNELYNKFYN